MSFVRLWPLLFSLSIAGVILLYMLKQKRKNEDVPSLALWREVFRDVKAKTPWEKLRKNILMFLQILILILLIFSFLEPLTLFGGREFRNLILVFDTTGSMKGKMGELTKFERGREEIKKLINSTKEGANITIITSGKESKVELSNGRDKNEVIKKIDDLKVTDSSGNIEDSLSLVRSLSNSGEGSEAIFITDKEFSLEDVKGSIYNLAQKGKNASIDLVSYKLEKDNISVVARISNRGAESYEGDFSLYGDDKILEVKSLNLSSGESVNVSFKVADRNISMFKGELSEKDDLMEDNVYYSLVRTEKSQKILLLSEKNIFMEKALATVQGIEVFKVNSLDNYNEKDEYDIYIFDGIVPNSLPAKGNLIFINTPTNDLFTVGEDIEGGEGNVTESNTITENIKNIKFGVRSFKDIQKVSYLKSFLNIGEKEAAFYGEKDGRKLIVLPFKLNDSDIVLKPQFPIMVHNMINYLSLSGILEKGDYIAGEEVELTPNINGENIRIYTPDNEEKVMALRFPMKNYDGTLNTGIYTVKQKVLEEEKEEILAVNFPSQLESDMKEEGVTAEGKEEFKIKGGRNLTPILIILSIIILMVEWYIYGKRS